MKVKKQKRHRKILTFYTACFGFRKPFRVLCDGTFVHHLLVNRITPADKALTNILTAPVKLYTTRCVLAELKRLGSSYTEALEAARQLIIARCEHEKCVKADACIMEVIGENNSEHFFIATQDTDLRKKLQEVPGVPLIFGLRNALFLEPPSVFQRQYVKTSEEGRSHMTQKEYQIFKNRVINRLAGEEAENSITEIMEHKESCSGDETINEQAVKRSMTARNQMGIKDKPQFKRKRAKGPNPLSCKKKKSGQNQNSGPLKEMKEGDSTVKRSRKRKRSHKRQIPVETGS